MTIDHDAIARAQAAIENGLIEALQSQAQADMDGTTVIVSRQACDEAAEFLPALYDEVKRLRAERDSLQVQCCMCGKTGLSTIEDGGPECEMDDGRWVCSVDCYDRAVLNPLEAEAERDALRDALANIAVMGFDNDPAVSNAIAKSAVNQARAALKGDTK